MNPDSPIDFVYQKPAGKATNGKHMTQDTATIFAVVLGLMRKINLSTLMYNLKNLYAVILLMANSTKLGYLPRYCRSHVG